MPSLQARPLSPHIQIYKWQITSVLSILHRFTGIAVCGGLIGFVGWLYLLSRGFREYSYWMSLLNIPLTQLGVWSIIFAFNYHCLNGLRHLIWDAGLGFSIKDVYRSGIFVVILSIVSTLIIFMVW